MKKIDNFDEVNEAGEFKQLPKGIYVLKITKVVDQPEKEYLEVYSDIQSGEFKNYFGNLEKSTGRDSSKSIRSYKPNALPFFKSFITAVERSNAGYRWNWDEKTLVGKTVVGVFGEEEYEKDGEIRVMVRLQEFRSTEAYNAGKIKVPEIKKLKVEDKKEDLSKLDTKDLPF